MKFATSSGHKDQVKDQDLGGRAKETCGHCGRGPSVIANRLTSIEDELVVICKLLETKPRRRSKCVSSLIRSSVKRIRKTFQFANAKKTKVNVNFCDIQVMNALDGSPLSHHNHVDDAHNGPPSPLLDQVVDASCKILSLTDPTHVHNDDDPSSHLPDQVDDASCKTLPSSSLPVQVNDASCKILPGEVVDSAVDSEDRSPDGRITDVLAQIHGEYDIKEFGDVAQNSYETANEKVV
ncbi:hypothetical protein K7X08_012041 [Anisodus acutangulus]|uniref:Uncharacterized protein n=1 Tax=Anisodus acutangulus TaxID=402998 RepID=A0A9Q1QZZ5_9SOLA|nr:hypothetical protein K7X08_012041 [Anisodus acutangulus]